MQLDFVCFVCDENRYNAYQLYFKKICVLKKFRNSDQTAHYINYYQLANTVPN